MEPEHVQWKFRRNHMAYGSGNFTYELVGKWAQVPEGISFTDVCGLAVDSQDRIYVLNRNVNSVIIFDREGNFLRLWSDENLSGRPHGIFVDAEGYVYITDDYLHIVSKYTPEGKRLMTLGNKDQPSDTGHVMVPDLYMRLSSIKRGGPPFNRPTDIGVSSSGEIFVSDGYANARVHKFTPEGTLLLSWGEPGCEPGQFFLPHSVFLDREDRVWVCDRENSRVQIFDSQGNFLFQWHGVARPADLHIDKAGTVYVCEIGPAHRISVFTVEGELQTRLIINWEEAGETMLLSPHSITVDSRGDIYVGENSALAGCTGDLNARAVKKFIRKI